MTRQLVTIRTVNELIPIEGADRIELARVDGWQCVVKKGDFSVGDMGMYFEIDSLLPADDARWAFLEPRKFRIKSMKLRGALSQGLLMPMNTLTPQEKMRNLTEFDTGLADILGVQKFEPPVPIGGEQKGTFPTHLVPKTDQERIQNMPKVLEGRSSSQFEITEKLDGTSFTAWYFRDPEFEFDADDPQIDIIQNVLVGVASRNWEMKLDDDNVYAKIFHQHELKRKLCAMDRNLAIQGEIIGGRVQGNKYKRGTQELYVFDIYDIDAKKYVDAAERMRLVAELGLRHVPVPSYFELFKDIPEAQPVQQGDGGMYLTLDLVLRLAEGKSMLHDTQREGLVFKCLTDAGLTFKAISNKFLLKHE